MSHLCLCNAASAPAASTSLEMNNNKAKYVIILFLFMFVTAACRCLCHPHLPNLPVDGEPTGSYRQNQCVFQKPLRLRTAFFPSPPFSLDGRFQHAADLELFFTSIWAVILPLVRKIMLRIHSRGNSKELFFIMKSFWFFLRKYEKYFRNFCFLLRPGFP